MIKSIIKKLFCKHNYVFLRNRILTHTEPDFSDGGCYNTWQEKYTELICTKCRKIKRVYNYGHD
jgi:hypothetical protein